MADYNLVHMDDDLSIETVEELGRRAQHAIFILNRALAELNKRGHLFEARTSPQVCSEPGEANHYYRCATLHVPKSLQLHQQKADLHGKCS